MALPSSSLNLTKPISMKNYALTNDTKVGHQRVKNIQPRLINVNPSADSQTASHSESK